MYPLSSSSNTTHHLWSPPPPRVCDVIYHRFCLIGRIWQNHEFPHLYNTLCLSSPCVGNYSLSPRQSSNQPSTYMYMYCDRDLSTIFHIRLPCKPDKCILMIQENLVYLSVLVVFFFLLSPGLKSNRGILWQRNRLWGCVCLCMSCVRFSLVMFSLFGSPLKNWSSITTKFGSKMQ